MPSYSLVIPGSIKSKVFLEQAEEQIAFINGPNDTNFKFILRIRAKDLEDGSFEPEDICFRSMDEVLEQVKIQEIEFIPERFSYDILMIRANGHLLSLASWILAQLGVPI